MLSLSLNIFAQIGGTTIYQHLNLSNSARIASLGGSNVSLDDNDLNFAYQNPSLINDTMDNNLALNFANYFADINYGYISYAKKIKKIGTVSLGFFHQSYGEFIAADNTGVISGDFGVKNYIISALWSKKLYENIRGGLEFKPFFLKQEDLNSFGIAFDIGVNYSKNGTCIGIVANNIGTQLKPFYEGDFVKMPFEIKAGFSTKLKHAPFRFSITLDQLQKYDLTYENPNEESNYYSLSEDTVSSNPNSVGNIADNLMRHVNIGVELTPTKNFYINFGYNYKRRQEMKISTRAFVVGMSWGVGIKISKYRISYAKVYQHLAESSNHFSITTNFNEFISKK